MTPGSSSTRRRRPGRLRDDRLPSAARSTPRTSATTTAPRLRASAPAPRSRRCRRPTSPAAVRASSPFKVDHEGQRRRDRPRDHRGRHLRERRGGIPNRRHAQESGRRDGRRQPLPRRRLLPAGVGHRVRVRGSDTARRPAARANANNSPPGRIEQWYPVTGGNQYLEGAFGGDVWSGSARMQPLPNTCRCAEQLDNGAGLSWSFSLGRRTPATTFSHYTVFSPRRNGGPAAPPSLRPGWPRTGSLEPALREPAQVPDPDPRASRRQDRGRHRAAQRQADQGHQAPGVRSASATPRRSTFAACRRARGSSRSRC